MCTDDEDEVVMANLGGKAGATTYLGRSRFDECSAARHPRVTVAARAADLAVACFFSL